MRLQALAIIQAILVLQTRMIVLCLVSFPQISVAAITRADGKETHFMIIVPMLFDLLFWGVDEGCGEEAIDEITFLIILIA